MEDKMSCVLVISAFAWRLRISADCWTKCLILLREITFNLIFLNLMCLCLLLPIHQQNWLNLLSDSKGKALGLDQTLLTEQSKSSQKLFKKSQERKTLPGTMFDVFWYWHQNNTWCFLQQRIRFFFGTFYLINKYRNINVSLQKPFFL